MLSLDKDQLRISFPEVHPDAVCTIEFQRTLRIPDDNRTHRLPPGLGRFELNHVDDFASKLPDGWAKRGGVFLPMYQAEALWIRFNSSYPFAIKVAAGKINAVSGEPWSTELMGRALGTEKSALADYVAQRRISADFPKQDYLSVPKQHWLDGFCVEKGKIRQFVAMPMGQGYTAEEQITGEAVHGGLQLIVYPLKAEVYARHLEAERKRREELYGESYRSRSLLCASPMRSMRLTASSASASMGMAAGGLMEQTIHEDSWGTEAFDQSVSSRCFVHLLNSEDFRVVTGKEPAHRAPTAADYTKNGLPWFTEAGAGGSGVEGSKKLQQLDSVANLGNKLGQKPLPSNDPLPVPPKVLMVGSGKVVRQGDF